MLKTIRATVVLAAVLTFTQTLPALGQGVLSEGRFGPALDVRRGGVSTIETADRRGEPPLTVEAWVKLRNAEGFNIIVSHEDKASGTHWELYSFAGTGAFSAYLPGYSPAAINSSAVITDDRWHHVAMTFAADRVRLFVDGERVADEAVQRTDMPRLPGPIMIGYTTHGSGRIGCDGVIDQVRISRDVREIPRDPAELAADDRTLSLWQFDRLDTDGRFVDAAAAGLPLAHPEDAEEEDHFEGFRETEARDDRWQRMDTGPTFSSSLATGHGQVMKAITVRLGDQRQAAVAFDTETLRMAAAWEGGAVRTDPMRFGLIVMPRPAGPVRWATTQGVGWAHDGSFADPRPRGLGPIPQSHGHYEGLYMHGDRVVLAYRIGGVNVHESPWIEQQGDITAWTRTIELAGGGPAKMAVCDVAESAAAVREVEGVRLALLEHGDGEQVTAAGVVGDTASLTAADACVALTMHASDAAPARAKVLIWNGPAERLADFARLVRASDRPAPLRPLTEGGPTRWNEPVITQGVVSNRDEPYVIDTLTVPYENPYNAMMFIGGHDFLPNGDAVVVTVHGDVWIVGGIDETLERLTWQRFATGLFQPLGVKVIDGEIYVRGRDQITRLHDLNNDGEADFYENFSNLGHVTSNGHEYVTGLETDAAGNFYFLKGDSNGSTDHDGTLLQLSPDGEDLEVYASGIRNGNGLGISDDGLITISPQEGTWTPASSIIAVRRGGFYGHMPTHHRDEQPETYDPPLCWIPRPVDNSSGGQVWASDDRFGPLSGHMLHLSFGRSTMMLTLMEQVEGVWQGGVVELPGRFLSGVHRGRVRPQDGQVYVSGLNGWVTNAVRDGCFQRVRYTGGKVYLPTGLSVHENGVRLTFEEPLNRELAEHLGSYAVQRWNYRWDGSYGSAEWSVEHPEQQGRDDVAVSAVHLSDDGRSVLLEIEDMQPVMQMGVRYNLEAADGSLVRGSVHHTINTLGEPASHPRH